MSLTSVYGLPRQNTTLIHFSPTALKDTDNRSPVNPPPNREFYRNKTTGKKVHKADVPRMVRPGGAVKLSKILVNATYWLYVEDLHLKYSMNNKGYNK